MCTPPPTLSSIHAFAARPCQTFDTGSLRCTNVISSYFSLLDTAPNRPPRTPLSYLCSCRTPHYFVQTHDWQVVQALHEEVQGFKSEFKEEMQWIKTQLKRRLSGAAEFEGSDSRLPKVRRGGSKGSPSRARQDKRGPCSSPHSALDSDHNDSYSGEWSSSDDEATRRGGRSGGSRGYRDSGHHGRRSSAPARGGGAVDHEYYHHNVAPPGVYHLAALPPPSPYHYWGGPHPQGATPGYPWVHPGLVYGQGHGPHDGGRGGGGSERGAVEREGGTQHRSERRGRRSGSEHNQRDHRSSDDADGGDVSSPRDARLGGDKRGERELKDGGGNDYDVNAEEEAGVGSRAAPRGLVVSEDPAAPAAEMDERNNADDFVGTDGRRTPVEGRQKGVSSRVRNGRGGEKRSRRRDGSGDGGRAAGGGSGTTRRHSDGGRHDSAGYHGAVQQAGFGYPMGAPGGVVDTRFGPPTTPIGHRSYPPASSPYVVHPQRVYHEHYDEPAGWAAGSPHHPYPTHGHLPPHQRLPSFEGHVSRRRRTRSPAPGPVGGEKGAGEGGGGAERGGGSRSGSGSWDVEHTAA